MLYTLIYTSVIHYFVYFKQCVNKFLLDVRLVLRDFCKKKYVYFRDIKLYFIQNIFHH